MQGFRCYDPERSEDFYAAGYWTRRHLLETVRDTARWAPGRTAVIDRQRQVTYAQLADLVEKKASRLRALGIGPGDIVAVQLPNSLHLVVAVLAVTSLGAVYHPLNPGYRLHDVTRILSVSQPTAYLYSPEFRRLDFADLVAQAKAALGASFIELALDLEADLEESIGAATPSDQTPAAPLDPDAPFLLGATSGSTGTPKLYLHTQNTQNNEARILNEQLGLGADDVFLAIAPMTHRGALMFGLLTAMAAGASLVVQAAYDAREVLDRIRARGVTCFMAIPTQVGDLLDLAEADPGAIRSLRIIMISGAPVHPALIRRLKRLNPACTPVTGYGTSETGYSFFTRPGDSLEKLQTCGRLMPGMEARLAPVAGGEGAEGEILLRGAFVFCGYHRDDEATRASFDADGWFRTGDLGRLDAEGYLTVTGRAKNTIIRGGLKIQAEEVENLLAGMPGVVKVVLVPVPDARLGERVAAWVEPEAGRTLQLGDICAFLEERGVSKFKWPERLLLVERIPLNPVGKIDRNTLTRMAVAEDAALGSASTGKAKHAMAAAAPAPR